MPGITGDQMDTLNAIAIQMFEMPFDQLPSEAQKDVMELAQQEIGLAGGGMMNINRMTAPLGYANGGPAGMVGRPTSAPELYEGFEPIHTGYAEALANINNPEYIHKWNMTRPRQPGLDEKLMQDYEPPIPRWGKAKKAVKDIGSGLLSLMGAGPAEGSEIDPAEALRLLRLQLMLEKGMPGSILFPSGDPDKIKELEEKIRKIEMQ